MPPVRGHAARLLSQRLAAAQARQSPPNSLSLVMRGVYNVATNAMNNHWGTIVPILREGEVDIISHSVAQTARLGARLGQLLHAGDVICLSGDMGTGKTVFSSGIGRGWGSTQPLTSPTYNLVHQHRRAIDQTMLYHLDCYRLQGVTDIDSIGFDDMIDERGVMIIEWAERIAGAIPAERLWIDLRVVESSRRIFTFEPMGARYHTLVQQFRDAALGK